MKGLKRGIVAFFFGQLLTLWRKDTKLQKAVIKEKNLGNKAKLMGKALFDFNKTIVEDAQQIDLQAQRLQVKQWFEKELNDLQQKIVTWEENAKDLTNEQIASFLTELEDRYNELVTKSKAWLQQVEENPEITEKIATVQKTITKIKKIAGK